MSRIMKLATGVQVALLVFLAIVARGKAISYRQAVEMRSCSESAYEAERLRLSRLTRTTALEGETPPRGDMLQSLANCAAIAGVKLKRLMFQESPEGSTMSADLALECDSTETLLRFVQEVELRCPLRVVIHNLEFFSDKRELFVALDLSTWVQATDGQAPSFSRR